MDTPEHSTTLLDAAPQLPVSGRRRFWRRVRRGIRITLSLLLGLLIGTSVAAWMFRKDIVESQLTKLLRTKVELDDVGFDFTNLPETTLYMEGVKVHPTNGKKLLLKANYAELTLDLEQLYFDKKYKEVQNLLVQDAFLYMELDSLGRRNFRVFAPYDPNRPRPDEVRVLSMRFVNTRVDYNMMPLRRYYALHLDSTNVGLRNFRKTLLFTGTAHGRSRYLDLTGFRVLVNQQISVNCRMTLHKPNKMMHFSPIYIQMGKSHIELVGDLLMAHERYYDLKFKTNYAEADFLLALLPDKAREALDRYSISGELGLQGTIKGYDDVKTNPHIHLGFRVRNTSIAHRKTGTAISQLQLVGKLDNGTENRLATTVLDIDSVVATFANRPLNARLHLSNFSDLFVEGHLDASLPVHQLIHFLGRDTLLEGSGVMTANINLAGSVRYLSSVGQTQHVRYNGYIDLENIALMAKRIPWHVEKANGRLELVGRDLQLERLTARLNNQPIVLKAGSEDFLSFLYGQKKVVKIKSDLLLDTLHLPNLQARIAQLRAEHDMPPVAKWDIAALGGTLPGYLDVSCHFHAATLYLSQTAYRSLVGEATLKEKVLSIPEIRLIGNGTTLNLGGEINTAGTTVNSFWMSLVLDSPDLPPALLDLGLWPAARPLPTATLQAGGKLRIQGAATKELKPKVKVEVLLEDGLLAQPAKNIKVHKLTLKTRLTEKHLLDPRHTPIVVDTVYGIANQFPFWASMVLESFASQKVNIRLNTRIGADVFLNYFSIPAIRNPSGELAFYVNMKGKLSDLPDREKLVRMPQSGYFTATNVNFDLGNSLLPIRQVNSRMHYDGNGVEVLYLNGEMNDDRFRVKGKLREILKFLYLDDAPLIADVDYQGDTLDLETLALLGSGGGRKGKLLRLPRHAHLKADVKLDHAYYQRLLMDKVNLNIELDNDYVQVHNADLFTCGGRLQAKGELDNANPALPVVNTWVKLQYIDIRKLAQSFDALDQKKLEELGLHGKLSMEGRLHQTIDVSTRRLFLPALAKFNIRITDGLAEDLSRFVKPSPLLPRRMLSTPTYFTLRLDSAYMADSTIHTPFIELISNKVNVKAYGWFHLANRFFYDVSAMRVGRSEGDEPDYYLTPKYYGRTFYRFTISEDPDGEKAMKVKFKLGEALENIFRSRKKEDN